MTTLLRGATVIDGTGAPALRADVAIDADRIVAVGDVDVDGAQVVDLSGLVLAPGFIDPHTHYDAQVFWDPDLTPSCWHGVTTVVTGNCGFGLAPLRPDQRRLIAETLENVEGMSADVLASGIPWNFATFPEYLNALDRLPLRLNLAVLVGHTPIRMFVMGDSASEREASDIEVRQMSDLVREAVASGAIGFSTSRSPTHLGASGRPVPSRFATHEELTALTSVLGDMRRGIFQATPGPGLGPREFAEISARIGRPSTWTALFTGMGDDLLASAGQRGTASDLLELTKALGQPVWPQIASLPQVMQITLEDPFPFGMLPSFARVLAAPRHERPAIYRDSEWRSHARAELPARWEGRWAKITIDESEANAALRNGPTIAVLAARRSMHPFDVLVELSLEENLKTRFRCVLGNDDEIELAALMQDPAALLAVSDGGAHVSQICDARYPTHLLRKWVRDSGVLTLEQAVWRMTGHPAGVWGIADRGVVSVGMAADLVAFDPANVGDDEPVRAWDMPAGGDRLVAGAIGIEGVWVNGERIVEEGGLVDGATPGRLLRFA